MTDTPETFHDTVTFYVRKCRQYLMRTRFTYEVVARELAELPEADLRERYGDLVTGAVGQAPNSAVRIERVLARSHLSMQKTNFELFLNRIAAAQWEFHFDQVVERWRRPVRVPWDGFGDTHAARFGVAELNVPTMGLSDLVGHIRMIYGVPGSFPPWAGVDTTLTLGDHPIHVWSQIAVAFQVRHLFEHRGGRVDRSFRQQVAPRWDKTSWRTWSELGPLGLLDPQGRAIKVPTRSDDFAATTEAMMLAADRIGQSVMATASS